MSEPLKIAVAGLGTVGAGTVKSLTQHAELLARRCGRPLRITAVSARDRKRERGVDVSGYDWYDDAIRMATEADADVIVELIGGSEGPAKALVEAAIGAGRHVVTANKALIAHHGTQLARAAEEKGVSLNYEAAVAGGIPVVKAIREGLAGNGLSRVYGILNGTCNYILTQMRQTGRPFDDVLRDAQDLGYAEADPAFDVGGVDAAHKLAILAAVAFGTELDFANVYVEGIETISPLDLEYAEKLGYRIKLMGIASMNGDGKLEQRVHPCMVPLPAPIAHIEDVFNAVVCDGDFVDTLLQEGRGAGEGPTASAVVADIVDIARGIRLPTFAVPADSLTKAPARAMDDHAGAYYVRLMVVDRPGVLADITAALRDQEISIESVLQTARAPGEPVTLVITVHETREANMKAALAQIEESEDVVEPAHLIRIVSL
jgi:homoserine dehydrogenase